MSEAAVKKSPAGELYESDFHAWTVAQAKALRSGEFASLDCANLAEEIETLGRSEKHEIASHLRVILLHLLKWQYQPERRSRSWQSTLLVQRQELAERLDACPSLRSYPARILDRQFLSAVKIAALETGLPEERFGKACPFTVGQILDPDFLTS